MLCMIKFFPTFGSGIDIGDDKPFMVLFLEYYGHVRGGTPFCLPRHIQVIWCNYHFITTQSV